MMFWEGLTFISAQKHFKIKFTNIAIYCNTFFDIAIYRNTFFGPQYPALVGDWSGTGRRLRRDLSATKSVAARFLCKHKNLAATDLVATRSPISRRLLCNLAGTDRGPCCDLCDRRKLSVAERSQSGCSVCLTGV